jgi:hypothetical protein
MSDVTRILSRIEFGDLAASDELLPLVYEELQRLAAHRLAQKNPGQTQPLWSARPICGLSMEASSSIGTAGPTCLHVEPMRSGPNSHECPARRDKALTQSERSEQLASGVPSYSDGPSVAY